MFKKGDAVLHPQHGAGIVIDTQTAEVSGVERRYYCIELLNASGTLMIPVDHARETGLRAASKGLDKIVAALSHDPQELAADYRQRHINVAAKIHSGDPALVAQALRDLLWRKQVEKLSMRDEQLKDEAHALLASIFALEPDLDFDAATQHLNAVVKQAMQTHVASSDMS